MQLVEGVPLFGDGRANLGHGISSTHSAGER
jgi:hypothetical protein